MWLISVLLGGAPRLAAQSVHIVHHDVDERLEADALESRRLRFEPWAGVLFDAYRNDGGDGRPGWIAGLRFGYEPGAASLTAGRRWRLVGEVARAETAEAGTAVLQDSLEVGFRSEWWLTTAGLEIDLAAGWMGLTVDGRAGAAWLRREIVAGDPVPPGTPGTTEGSGSDPFPALAVGVTGWRHLGHAVQLRLRLEDVVTDPFGALEHSPAVALGFRFVFE